MEQTLVDAALTQSIWAALSLALIFYILKKQDSRDQAQEKRENKYQGIIATLSERLTIVEELREDVKEIKKFVSPTEK